MKITEAYENRDKFIAEVEKHDPCQEEFKALKAAQNKEEFEVVILNNYHWCVKKGVLETWLPIWRGFRTALQEFTST